MLNRFLKKRLPLVNEFLKTWIRYTSYVQEVIVTLLSILLLGSVLIWKYENVNFGNAIYFTLITGLSVGYGDITPETVIGKIVSVCIGIVGVLFVGLSVAIATRALTETAKRHYELNHKSTEPQSLSTSSQ
ncbi:MAG: potassium channel family protein [Planctomycetes bacterium]|nr:potassium channel family protein [Planctomycetota bacterium]MCH9725665.1 potassium channel family protein [Planctomycetota bacterium]MCH9777719.1 potassium channel family protein [Planctomycetota bacterium]MCH9793175.1 potassium channel family protein [Planctomycetota bacterium]MDF1744164.1 potassium channel family protein [Gimesia sp.]